MLKVEFYLEKSIRFVRRYNGYICNTHTRTLVAIKESKLIKMKSLLVQIVLFIGGIILITGCDGRKLVKGDDLLVLSGVTLIDGTGSEPKENATIVLEGNRIVYVGFGERFKFPNDATHKRS